MEVVLGMDFTPKRTKEGAGASGDDATSARFRFFLLSSRALARALPFSRGLRLFLLRDLVRYPWVSLPRLALIHI